MQPFHMGRTKRVEIRQHFE